MRKVIRMICNVRAMKKTLKSFVVIAAFAALFSCAKETPIIDDNNESKLIDLTIVASNPQADPATKTEMNGSTPYWSVGDAIGVSNGTSTNYKFTTGITEASKTASFTGTTAVSNTLYAYYPYSNNGIDNDNGAKIDLPANQNPTVSSFDGNADIMVSKSFTVSEETKEVKNLEFARLGAIVKIVLKDPNGIMTTPQYPATVSLTAESDLAGRVYVDMVNQKLGSIYYNQSKTVTANYSASTKYAIDGTNATYLVVYPQTLAAGSIITISASTEDYSILKEITVPRGGIEFLAGKVTTLNIALDASQITSDSGDALPFYDNMSWANYGESDATTDISASISTESEGLYTSASKAYKGIGGLKLGTSSANGYIITKELDLSGAFYIAVKGAKWDSGNLVVTIDDVEVINASFADVNYVNIDSGTYTKKSKVKIATSAKRGRIYEVSIKSGEYVPAPIISVVSDNPMSVSSETGSYTIDYTISNPVESSSLTASSNNNWITDIDCTSNGEVIFNVSAQESGAAAREGTITLSYPDANDVVVTVNQAAAGDAKGTLENPYTVEEVIAVMDEGIMNSCYITGKISSIVYPFDANYGTGTFFISDDGNSDGAQFEAFKVNFLENKSWLNGNTQIAVGDVVIVYGGELSIYNSNTYETKSNSGSYLYSLNSSTSETVPTITKSDITGISSEGVTDATATVTFANNEGWTPSVTYDGTIVTSASISGSTITYAVAKNTGDARTGFITVSLSKAGRTDAIATINVGQLAGNGNTSVTVSFSASNSGGMSSSQGSQSGTLDGVTITISNGAATSGQIRIYKNATITISAPSGKTITNVEFTCTASGTDQYGPGCFAETEGYSYSGNVGTWTGSSASVSLKAYSNQVRTTAIKVTYN